MRHFPMKFPTQCHAQKTKFDQEKFKKSFFFFS